MGYFADPAEVERYIGGIFRLAANEVEVAGGLEASRTTLRIVFSDPVCEMHVSLSTPLTVLFGASDVAPDVTLALTADALDGFFRGRYSILDGLARGEIGAKGPVSRILKILPMVESLAPSYCALVADKDAGASSRAGWVPSQRSAADETQPRLSEDAL